MTLPATITHDSHPYGSEGGLSLRANGAVKLPVTMLDDQEEKVKQVTVYKHNYGSYPCLSIYFANQCPQELNVQKAEHRSAPIQANETVSLTDGFQRWAQLHRGEKVKFMLIDGHLELWNKQIHHNFIISLIHDPTIIDEESRLVVQAVLRHLNTPLESLVEDNHLGTWPFLDKS